MFYINLSLFHAANYSINSNTSKSIICVFSRIYLEEIHPELKSCKVSIESDEQQKELLLKNTNMIIINNETVLNDIMTKSKTKNIIILFPAYDDTLHYPVYKGGDLNNIRNGTGCHRGKELFAIIDSMKIHYKIHNNNNIKFCVWAYSIGYDRAKKHFKRMELMNKTWYHREDVILILRNAMKSMYRNGIDISYPPSLVNTGNFDIRNLSKTKLMNNKHIFAYFRGKRNDERDTVNRIFKETNSKIIINREYGGNGYNMMQEMSESMFSLIIRGDIPYTMRYTQAICSGSVPVFVTKDWIAPFEELIPFETYGIKHDTTKLYQLYEHLIPIKNDTIYKLTYAAYEVCLNYYRSPAKMIQSVLQILSKRYQ